MSPTPHPGYRPCAGVALVNAQGWAFIGRRRRDRGGPALAHEWQMPQGGIDPGEAPLAAARRELHEEANVTSAELLAEAPKWIAYDLPSGARSRFGGRFRGQTQKWFLFRFTGEEAEIDVERPAGGAHPPEFSSWRWEAWEALPDLVVPFKRGVYVQVAQWFAGAAQRPA